MKYIFIMIILSFLNVPAFSKDFTCGFGDYPSASRFPARSDVIRVEVINDEVTLNIAHPDVTYSIHYSVLNQLLANTFTLTAHQLTDQSVVEFPYSNYPIYISTIYLSDKALYCWFEN